MPLWLSQQQHPLSADSERAHKKLSSLSDLYSLWLSPVGKTEQQVHELASSTLSPPIPYPFSTAQWKQVDQLGATLQKALSSARNTQEIHILPLLIHESAT